MLTLLFATAPMELLWSRDVRMYQQAQFFAILFVVFFARALQNPRSRSGACSMAMTMPPPYSPPRPMPCSTRSTSRRIGAQRPTWA